MTAKSYHAVIKASWYDIGGRKYIDLLWADTTRRVKVPFRYNRVMCHVDGLTPIQELPVDTAVHVVVETVGGYYVLKHIRPRA